MEVDVSKGKNLSSPFSTGEGIELLHNQINDIIDKVMQVAKHRRK